VDGEEPEHPAPIEDALDRGRRTGQVDARVRVAGRGVCRSCIACQPSSGDVGSWPRINRAIEWIATRPELPMYVRPERSRTIRRAPPSRAARPASMTCSKFEPSSSPASAMTATSGLGRSVVMSIARLSRGGPPQLADRDLVAA
jgi:hypothetical protein